MIEEIEYKEQGNAADSWIIRRWETAKKKNLIYCEIVYTDPSIEEKTDMSKVDLSTMTSEQLTQLKTALGL
jgi:hypothetical protein